MKSSLEGRLAQRRPTSPIKRPSSALKSFFSKKATSVDAAVAQAMGSLGNAWLVDDNLHVPERVLMYRLVSLSPDGAWKDGLLLEMARMYNDDAALHTALEALLTQPWRSDAKRTEVVREMPPITVTRDGIGWAALRKLHATGRLVRVLHSHTDSWGDVIVNGRGAVGETVLHLCCLLQTPLHLRIIRFLVPWLSGKSTDDRGGVKVPALDASYLGQPYNGEVALHFAVIHQNLPLCQLLVEHGATVVNKHASGDFLYSNLKL